MKLERYNEEYERTHKKDRSLKYEYFVEYVKNIKKYGEKTALLFRVGDFYEIYGFDVEGYSLTNYRDIARVSNYSIGNEKGNSYTNPCMVGFPYHASQKVFTTLQDNGYTIVVYEQFDNPSAKEKRMIRKIDRVISPVLNDNRNNITSLFFEGNVYSKNRDEFYCGLSNLDLITGEISFTELYYDIYDKKKIIDDLHSLLIEINSGELVVCSNNFDNPLQKLGFNGRGWFNLPFIKKYREVQYDNIFNKTDYISNSLKKYYNEDVNDKVLFRYKYASIACVVLLRNYSYYTFDNISITKNLRFPIKYTSNNKLKLENNTTEQLRLEELFEIINFTASAFGKRELRKRLYNPINNENELKDRWDLVDYFYKRNEFNNILNGISDIPKILRRMSGLNDILLIKKSLEKIKEIYKKLSKDFYLCDYNIIRNVLKFINKYIINDEILNEEIKKFKDIILDQNILKEGMINHINNIIQNQYDKKIVNLPATLEGEFIKVNESKYKIFYKNFNKYNFYKDENNILYPSTRKDYYTCRNLLNINERLYVCYANIKKIENEIINKIKEYILSFDYSNIINIISSVDIAISTSKCAKKYGYYRPQISNKLSFEKLRNPIGERKWEHLYKPHNLSIDKSILLYGLNSSGKSVFMRAVGLNIILSQAGLFCSGYFSTPLYTKLFTRIGNGDKNFYSSFEMECLDIKSIIHRSDQNTFIILDEMTSSTENESAIAISYAMIKRLQRNKSTFLFATHLTKLKDIVRDENIYIKSMQTIITKDGIEYTREIIDGVKERYYGIEVAKFIIDDNEFIKDATSLRNKIKSSKYCSEKIVEECEKCGKIENLHTHHIHQQKDKNENGLNEGYILNNSKGNLMVLCEDCHHKIHS